MRVEISEHRELRRDLPPFNTMKIGSSALGSIIQINQENPIKSSI